MQDARDDISHTGDVEPLEHLHLHHVSGRYNRSCLQPAYESGRQWLLACCEHWLKEPLLLRSAPWLGPEKCWCALVARLHYYGLLRSQVITTYQRNQLGKVDVVLSNLTAESKGIRNMGSSGKKGVHNKGRRNHPIRKRVVKYNERM